MKFKNIIKNKEENGEEERTESEGGSFIVLL